MRHKPAAKRIASLLSDESGGIRVNAIDALVDLKAASAAPALLKCLADPQWYVRQHAARACGDLGIKKSVPKLRALAKTEKRKAVLETARGALEKLR